MIGIVVITHGRMGIELVKTAEGIVGSLEGVRAVASLPSDSLEEIMRKISATIEEVDMGEGVILLTDLFGASCSTACITLDGNTHLKIISGVNLPMLIDAVFHRDKYDLAEVADMARKAAKRAIVDVGETVAERMKEET
ncbi:MAG: PTS sugar transporter subunit IIA [bacterium]|nr:PTS sugar transporter subunit IIA [bacterium]